MLNKKFKEKLDLIRDFRIGRYSGKDYPIVFRMIGPSTDGKKIFIPLTSELSKDMQTSSVRHEADHIKDMINLSKELDPQDETSETGKQYIESFFWREEVAENPALAFDISNIVWDNKIDTAARDELSGEKKIFEKERKPLLKRRPPTAPMKDLDKFRELFIQKLLLEETQEKVPEKWQELLGHCTKLAKQAERKDIEAILEATDKIYQEFKKNFDIKQKIRRLPGIRGNKRDQVEGFNIPQGQGGYSDDSESGGKQTKPDKEKKKKDKKGKGNKKKKDKNGKGKKDKEKDKESKKPQKESEKSGWLNKPRKKILSPELTKLEKTHPEIIEFIKKYLGEIEQLIRIFRLLKKEKMSPRKARAGDEIELEEYLQTKLEKQATGVMPDNPYFLEDARNKLNPGWAALMDISTSTDSGYNNILNELKATMIILGETLRRSDFHFGLFAFNSGMSGKDYLYTLKDFQEKYSEKSLGKILELQSDGGTGMFDSIDYLGEQLSKILCSPRALIIVTDGEPNNLEPVKKALEDARKKGVVLIFLCIAAHIPPVSKIVDHYIRIKKDEIDRLPAEILKIFRIYRLVR